MTSRPCGNRARPILARVLERVGQGDTLVVVRIDRLVRSLPHLLGVIEQRGAEGTFFRSLTDPIDTASPSRCRSWARRLSSRAS